MDLYHKETDEAVGLRLVPKLKYEHIYLTTFSKMQVDLAAQVCLPFLVSTKRCIACVHRFSVQRLLKL